MTFTCGRSQAASDVDPRRMSTWLGVEHLYLSSSGAGRALLLLPLLPVSPLPALAKNVCYLLNRVEKHGARFVSYHFIDQPKLKDQSTATSAAIQLLSNVSSAVDR